MEYSAFLLMLSLTIPCVNRKHYEGGSNILSYLAIFF